MVDKQNDDGTWSEAEPILYYPNIFERIVAWMNELMHIQRSSNANWHLIEERPRKKCKYHCEYSDGRNCYYTGEDECIFNKRK